MKHIVILGGGFAGVAAVLYLQKHLTRNTKITLIDKNPYHLFTPSLYEVATSEAPKGNIAIPFEEIVERKVEVVKGIVEKIDPAKQTVTSQDDVISYDYLLITLGSQPAYYHIPGLEEHSIALKSLQEAVVIKNKIRSMCCEEGKCNKKVRVVIGGGGFSGTELAAELLTYKDKIAKQHHLDPNCLEITIIQGSDRLLKELDAHVSKIAQDRLHLPNVTFAFGGHISKVTKTSVFTDDNKVYTYDILIWTGGVEANAIPQKSGLPTNKRGQLIVNSFLQVEEHDNIFAAGDIAQFIDPKTTTPAPTVAQVAEEEAVTAAKNILRLIKNQDLEAYTYRHFGYIVPIRGRYAVAELMGVLHFDGLIGWILQQLIFLRYLLGILPLFKALKHWNRFELELTQ